MQKLCQFNQGKRYGILEAVTKFLSKMKEYLSKMKDVEDRNRLSCSIMEREIPWELLGTYRKYRIQIILARMLLL